MDQVRVGNLVAVGGVDFFPLRGIAVEVLGDLAQIVARLDDVGKSAAPPVPEELPVLEDPPTSEKSAFGFGLSLENVIATPRFD